MRKDIILTTSEPSFMCGIFDNEETRKENHSRTTTIYKKYNTAKTKNLNTRPMSIYFDGDLESQMGYDVPTLIEGTIPELKDGDITSVIAVTLEDKVINAVMLTGIDIGMTDSPDTKYPYLFTLILTIDEAEQFLSNQIDKWREEGYTFESLINKEKNHDQ